MTNLLCNENVYTFGKRIYVLLFNCARTHFHRNLPVTTKMKLYEKYEENLRKAWFITVPGRSYEIHKNDNNQPFFRQRKENPLVDQYFEFPRLLLRTDYLSYQHLLRSIETDNSEYPELNGPITPEVIHVICVNKP